MTREFSAPTFLVIGAQKCGTTSLYQWLQQHPQVHMSPKKELHYFDREQNFPDHAWYREQFSRGEITRTSPVAVGEATPVYCYWPSAIDRIYAFDPTLLLVMIVRNPIDRAISHYWMEQRRGRDRLTIAEAFAQEPQRVALGSAGIRFHSYLSRGRYVEQLDAITRRFSRSQVHVARLEDIAADRHHLAHLADFLGIDADAGEEFGHHRSADNPPLEEGLRGQLVDYFTPFNAQLGAKYGIETSSWV